MAEVSLELLQGMVQRVLDMLAQQSATLDSHGRRLTTIDNHLAALDAETISLVQRQVDPMNERIARIERRLELVDAG